MFKYLNIHKHTMTVKTITVSEEAYEAFKSLKSSNESFSDLMMRVAKRRPLSDFFGILSPETADRMEKTIRKMRDKRNLAHKARIKRIVEELG